MSFGTILGWDTDPSALIFAPILDEFRYGLFHRDTARFD